MLKLVSIIFEYICSDNTKDNKMDNEAVIQEVSVVRDYKVYKEKPYSNSEGELFDLTINV